MTRVKGEEDRFASNDHRRDNNRESVKGRQRPEVFIAVFDAVDLKRARMDPNNPLESIRFVDSICS